MHILHHAVAVVGRGDAQVGGVARVPGIGQVADRQLAFQQRQFEVEAQHDVQVVGHLVGLDANQRALDLVDRAVERDPANLAELLGEVRLQPRVEELQKPRLRPTMFSHRRDWLSCTPADVPLASGVPSKSGLMPCSYMAWPASWMVLNSAGPEQVFGDARGDAHVAERELGHERVVGLVLAAALEVVAEAA